jgi:hypothetical protein
MSASTEPKSPTNEKDESENSYNVGRDDESESAYSVEEEDESDTDHFAHVKPHFLKTPSVLNAIIDQIHPDIIAKFVK